MRMMMMERVDGGCGENDDDVERDVIRIMMMWKGMVVVIRIMMMWKEWMVFVMRMMMIISMVSGVKRMIMGSRVSGMNVMRFI